MKLDFHPAPAAGSGSTTGETELAQAREELQRGKYEAVVEFPADFAERLAQFRTRLKPVDQPGHEVGGADSGEKSDVPGPAIYYNSARESSQIAYSRVERVLDRWTASIGRQNLAESGIPAAAARPFLVDPVDVAEADNRKAAVWSKILPFVLLLWALTGAFYPAVDLCAGEKERGTLETLLSSPAERSEIVWGKLLTVMLFSMATAILNLISMGVTGAFVVSQLDFGPPPLASVVWLLLALVPISALFSGLCLALAAFARSTKEGQYYLMPLVLITMPLTILPMSPGVELNLGNSLIPITGVVLLLRTLLEGNYAQALPYVPLVVGVTLACCLAAVRWAADQFNSESVLFRESERLDMGLWLRNLLRDRGDTPSVAEAVFCGVLILTIKFFLSLVARPTHGFADFAQMIVVLQLAVIATPALMMTIMLTRKPAQTLLLRRPPWAAVPAAALLAVCLHPAVMLLLRVVQFLYPLSEDIGKQLKGLLGDNPPLGWTLLLIAVVPAICEELAFRGFILSGLRHLGHKWRAIALTSLLFGAMHAVFQQSISATIVGLVIGFIAVQTGSLLPAIAFHMVHNALGVVSQDLVPRWIGDGWLISVGADGSFEYRWPAIALGSAAAALLLYWFQRLSYTRTSEETLQEAIDQEAAQGVA